ncbi:hypothetical protein APHWI1_1534 [Anaplasma phagocytophilum str. ApWI1]|uniref:Uncharacterized protein n=1 Tax=Anaplasma phagocytophilum str. ApWI1 TaxID=1359155 RepID=A0A0F3Q1E4_ANAPH|nr:hypothetical protein APHWI1_1534 [Anaplasma phagocytophilum str. ApWI1]
MIPIVIPYIREPWQRLIFLQEDENYKLIVALCREFSQSTL